MSQFEGLVESLFCVAAPGKRSLRAWVVDDVAVGRRLMERVEFILQQVSTSPKPSRLDDAIDILDDVHVDLTAYLREARFRRSLERKHDDVLYVLIRAAGRRPDQAAEFIVPWATKSDRPSVREAAVEALADLGTPAASIMLRQIAELDESSSVREAAKEILNDLDEA
jgi:hypothetical protein